MSCLILLRKTTAPGFGKTCLPSSPALAALAPLRVKSHQWDSAQEGKKEDIPMETLNMFHIHLIFDMPMIEMVSTSSLRSTHNASYHDKHGQ